MNLKTLSGTTSFNVKKFFLALAVGLATGTVAAEDITTLDGQKYENVRDVSAKPNGLFFVIGDGSQMHGVTLAVTNLSAETQDKYHCDGFSLGLRAARLNQRLTMTKSMGFSLSQLDAAKKKAKEEKKLIGFILVWDQFFVLTRPLDAGSEGAFAHFYDVFHNNLVLVFVSHEREIGSVPAAVSQGYSGPEEGGYAPTMAVVTADCSKLVCQVPFADKDYAGREEIFRKKIAVIKSFLAENPSAMPK